MLIDPAAGDVVATIVESTCRFARSLRYSGAVEIGLASAGLGTSTLIWHLGAFTPADPAPAAEATLVQVTVDRRTGRPVPFPSNGGTVSLSSSGSTAATPGLRTHTPPHKPPCGPARSLIL